MFFHSYYFLTLLCTITSVSANKNNNFSTLEAQKAIKNDALEIYSVVASKSHPPVHHIIPNDKLESHSKPICHWMNIFRVHLPYAPRPLSTVRPKHHIIKRNKRSLDMSLPIFPEQYRVAISRSLGPALLSSNYQTEKNANQKRESGPQITLHCRPIGNKNFGAHTITRRATIHISVDPNATEDAIEPYENINLTNFTVYLEDPEPTNTNFQESIPLVDEQNIPNLYQEFVENNAENPEKKFLEDKLPFEIIPQNNLQILNQFSNVSSQRALPSGISNADKNSRLNVPGKLFRDDYELRKNPLEKNSIKKFNNVSSEVLKGYIKMKPTPNTDDYKPISFRWQLPVNEQEQPSLPEPPPPALDAPFNEYQRVLDKLPQPPVNSNTNPSPDNKVQVWGYSNHFLFPTNSKDDGKQNKSLESKLESEMKIDKTNNKKRVVDVGAIAPHRSSATNVLRENKNQTFRAAAEIFPTKNQKAEPKCTTDCHRESEIETSNFEENQSEWLRNIQKQYYPYWPFYYVLPKSNDENYDDAVTEDKQN